MGWTGIARRDHSREGLRYPSDMTEQRMAADGAVHSACEDRRSAADDGHARGCERAAVHSVERRRVADVAQMLCPGVDGAALFLRLAEHRLVRARSTPCW